MNKKSLIYLTLLFLLPLGRENGAAEQLPLHIQVHAKDRAYLCYEPITVVFEFENLNTTPMEPRQNMSYLTITADDKKSQEFTPWWSSEWGLSILPGFIPPGKHQIEMKIVAGKHIKREANETLSFLFPHAGRWRVAFRGPRALSFEVTINESQEEADRKAMALISPYVAYAFMEGARVDDKELISTLERIVKECPASAYAPMALFALGKNAWYFGNINEDDRKRQIGLLDRINLEYPRSPVCEEALFLLVQAHLSDGIQSALPYVKTLTERFPNSKFLKVIRERWNMHSGTILDGAQKRPSAAAKSTALLP